MGLVRALGAGFDLVRSSRHVERRQECDGVQDERVDEEEESKGRAGRQAVN